MIDVFPFAGVPVGVFGLGASGRAAAIALSRSGADVWAWDDSEKARERAAAEGVPLRSPAKIDWRKQKTLVWSPGIPHARPKPHPLAEAALKANVELICDIELLARAQGDAAYVGVTGTNGKSTTTALIGHVARGSGRKVEVGGNLGVPALELAPLGGDGIYVLEMSSYQLELTYSLAFDVAVLLNISPDHLDRHGGLEGYVKAKRRIFHNRNKPRTVIVGVDDDNSRGIFDELKGAGERTVIPISGFGPAAGGVYATGGWLHDDTGGGNLRVCRLASVASLRGDHNGQNAAAAYAACRAVGILPSEIAERLRSFPGLAHRQEIVALKDGVLYVNDSKATNADAADRAIRAYDHIYWIAGGQAKEGGIDGLTNDFPRIERAFLIGEAAEDFASVLSGRVDCEVSGTLETAVRSARDAAMADRLERPVVLLSPACASWDQFKSFEDRGDAFRRLVEQLPGEEGDPFALADAPEDRRGKEGF